VEEELILLLQVAYLGEEEYQPLEVQEALEEVAYFRMKEVASFLILVGLVGLVVLGDLEVFPSKEALVEEGVVYSYWVALEDLEEVVCFS
jgi:hypothetical protein